MNKAPSEFLKLHRLSSGTQWHRHRNDWADVGARKHRCLEDEDLSSSQSSRHLWHQAIPAEKNFFCNAIIPKNRWMKSKAHKKKWNLHFLKKSYFYLRWLWECSPHLLPLLHYLHLSVCHGLLQTSLHLPPYNKGKKCVWQCSFGCNQLYLYLCLYTQINIKKKISRKLTSSSDSNWTFTP